LLRVSAFRVLNPNHGFELILTKAIAVYARSQSAKNLSVKNDCLPPTDQSSGQDEQGDETGFGLLETHYSLRNRFNQEWVRFTTQRLALYPGLLRLAGDSSSKWALEWLE